MFPSIHIEEDDYFGIHGFVYYQEVSTFVGMYRYFYDLGYFEYSENFILDSRIYLN